MQLVAVVPREARYEVLQPEERLPREEHQQFETGVSVYRQDVEPHEQLVQQVEPEEEREPEPSSVKEQPTSPEDDEMDEVA